MGRRSLPGYNGVEQPVLGLLLLMLTAKSPVAVGTLQEFGAIATAESSPCAGMFLDQIIDGWEDSRCPKTGREPRRARGPSEAGRVLLRVLPLAEQRLRASARMLSGYRSNLYAAYITDPLGRREYGHKGGFQS